LDRNPGAISGDGETEKVSHGSLVGIISEITCSNRTE